jgi:hypothetical protein
MQNKVRILAYYLPQYHPIPENDEWWGNGFTEWTNVAKAKPLYKGHYQPNIPADLGFYDLRIPETRQAQADMAKEYGIEGFLYWHYWFGGKQILERPFKEVLKSGKPDYPFCLGWANHTWSGIWIGQTDNVLIKQTYPGEEDYISHFYEVLPAFKDPRYIKVENKPFFYVYNPDDIPDNSTFITIWNKLAQENGLDGVYFVGPVPYPDNNADRILKMGYNAIHSYRFEESFSKMKGNNILKRILRKIQRSFNLNNKVFLGVYDYHEFIRNFTSTNDKQKIFYPTIYPNWDNSPRSGKRALILENSTPEYFRKHVSGVLKNVKDKPFEHRIIILKSWNEWAEGNYMEPDLRYGRRYLEVLKEEIEKL